jgi:oligopeptidase B
MKCLLTNTGIYLFAFATVIIFACQNEKTASMEAPKADVRPHQLEIHNHTRVDNYYWLNERENPEVIAYLESENAYTQSMLAHTQGLQEKLYKEMTGRLVENESTAPYVKNGYYYYSRYEEKKDYPFHCRKEGINGKEQIMLDVNEMAKGYDYFQVGGLSVSPDNNLLAYGVDTVSRRQYDLKFKNLITGEIYSEYIPNTSANAVWAADNKTIFYVLKDPVTLRTWKVMKHKLGTDPVKDTAVFEERDSTFSVYVSKSRSGKYIMISSYATVSSEVRILSADDPDGHFRVFEPRKRDHEYSIDHREDQFYIMSNLDGAKNFMVATCPEGKTSSEHWKTLVPAREEVLVEGVNCFKDFVVLSERSNGLPKLRIIESNNNHQIDFPEESYVAWLGPTPEYNTSTIRIRYTSLVAPMTDYDYEVTPQELNVVKVQEIPGGYEQDSYESERIFATASDGTKIPISIVYKKGFNKNGSQPLLLYGYGSYGYSMDPYFSTDRLSLLDRGFAYAIAHIRGGQEMGRAWYEEGKLLKKKNTFTDFIDCGRYLINNQYTSSDNLFAMGGSAGGLLMGAVINIAPEMWKGVVAAVPFVDVITTMLDESIPLTTGEFDEWGNPKDKTYYDYMLTYSPYDNVEEKEYPAMLVTTGLHDSQVQYWEPAKWVAKLRVMKKDNNTLFLHTEMSAGHGGASGRYKRYEEQALVYAFILDQAGLSN